MGVVLTIYCFNPHIYGGFTEVVAANLIIEHDFFQVITYTSH
jgi:hypothetical protein